MGRAKAAAAEPTGLRTDRPVRYARDFVRAVNPENDLEVVFKPGELLPAWAEEPEHDSGTA